MDNSYSFKELIAVKLLIEAGADVNITNIVTDRVFNSKTYGQKITVNVFSLILNSLYFK